MQHVLELYVLSACLSRASACDICTLLLAQGFGSIPGASEAMKLWPTNYAMGRRSRDGAFLVFEAWGRVDVRALCDANARTVSRLEMTQLYRDELLNLLLMESSYRKRRILHGVLLVDAGGMTSEHAEMLRFLRVSRKLRRAIYPGLVKECVVANVLTAGAAARALKALGLPESAVFFDKNLVSRKRRSIFDESFKRKSHKYRVAPSDTKAAAEKRSAAMEWRGALFLAEDETLRAWDEKNRQLELAVFNDDSEAWTPMRTGLDNIQAEWRRMKGSRFLLRRFTTIIDERPEIVYRAAAESLGTSSDTRFGDRSVLDARLFSRIDDSHFMTWQMHKLPPGLNDRLFVAIGFTDETNLLIVTRDASENKALVKKMCSESEFLSQKKFTVGYGHYYSFRFSHAGDGRCRVEHLFQSDPKGGIPSMVLNSDRVGVNMAKG